MNIFTVNKYASQFTQVKALDVSGKGTLKRLKIYFTSMGNGKIGKIRIILKNNETSSEIPDILLYCKKKSSDNYYHFKTPLPFNGGFEIWIDNRTNGMTCDTANIDGMYELN